MRGVLRLLVALSLAGCAVQLGAQSNNSSADRCVNGAGDDSITGCTAAIDSLRRNLAEMFFNRGIIYSIDGKEVLAAADFSEALRLRPNYADALYHRGNSYLHRKAFARAVADYNKAIRIDPINAKAFHNRGLAKRALGRIAEANADQARALDLVKPPAECNPAFC